MTSTEKKNQNQNSNQGEYTQPGKLSWICPKSCTVLLCFLKSKSQRCFKRQKGHILHLECSFLVLRVSERRLKMLTEHFLEGKKCKRAWKGIALFKPHTLYANLMIVEFQFLKGVAIFHKPEATHVNPFHLVFAWCAIQKIIIDYDNHRQVHFSILLMSLEVYR